MVLASIVVFEEDEEAIAAIPLNDVVRLSVALGTRSGGA
jgi:hypothetical protein